MSLPISLGCFSQIDMSATSVEACMPKNIVKIQMGPYSCDKQGPNARQTGEARCTSKTMKRVTHASTQPEPVLVIHILWKTKHVVPRH